MEYFPQFEYRALNLWLQMVSKYYTNFSHVEASGDL
jgi:hypothetical protein